MFPSRWLFVVLLAGSGSVLSGVGFVRADPAIGASVFAASITRALVPPRRDSTLLGARYGSAPPEIIVNRAPTSTVAPARDTGVGPGGYNYDVPASGYLPPESGPTFADEPPPPPPSVVNNYLPPVASQDIPLADEPVFPEPQPPQVVGDYLPPNLPPQRDEAFGVVPGVEQGYNYNAPTTTSTSTFAPLGDEGFEEPSDPDSTGYRYDPPANIYIPPSGGGVGRSLRDDPTLAARSPIRLQLNELACLRNSGGYFRAALTIQSALESVPLVDVENDGGDSLGACEVRLDQSRLLVDIAWPDFGRCGVSPCGQTPARELCLRVRFPAIAGMRTASDPVLTLQCRIQQRIVARTHSVRLGVAEDVQGRAAAGTAFAVGGSQRPFRSQLGIFRRQNAGGGGGGAFTRALQPGGAVMLGEELMLRTQVSAGDGWNFTRLSEVVMQRLSPSGTVLNSASLVNANGCLNPLMRAISPVAPVFEAPLGYRLGFRAAMFQGMRSGDEMILRVRIVGCVDRRECLVENCQTTVRSKRDTETPANGTTTTTTTTVSPVMPSTTAPPPLAETASIAFRIMLPPEVASSTDRQDNPSTFLSSPHSLLWITVGTTATVVVAIGLLALLLVVLRHKRRPSYDEYRSD
uniref:ZP domain-containing protein n=1 Tax=Anopheles farauti TaxID=69004 RepID=A0A182QD02_9DIPT